MAHEAETGALKPVDFSQLSAEIPELVKFNLDIQSISFDEVLDSSNMTPEVWIRIAKIIEENYDAFDGFVVLHGSDTMAYTASALSFMLENLSKAVVFTGSQLPIGMLRTDGKENLITAIEIAASKSHGNATVPEVSIYFENVLLRANRTLKYNAEHFDAFVSPNYPHLAKAGIKIAYNRNRIQYVKKGILQVHTQLDSSVVILKLFPGISPEVVNAVLQAPGLRGIILESYGAGNTLTAPWFLDALKNAIAKGMIVVNVTQCLAGTVEQGLYETSSQLNTIGVIGGADMTTEAATTKLMLLLGHCETREEIIDYLRKPLAGELSV